MNRRSFIRGLLIAPFIAPAIVRAVSSRRSNAYIYRRNLIRPSSKDLAEAKRARDAFAAFISPVILTTINEAPINSYLFCTPTYK